MKISDYREDVFHGYVAALLDGEGCIEIHPRECGVRIRIANTFRAVLDDIAARFMFGHVQTYRKRPAHHLPLYAYAVSNAHDVRRLLQLVRPFLQIKAERADRALSVIARMQARMDAIDARNREILAAIESGEEQKAIGTRYGLSQSLVSRIKCGHLWRCERKRLNARVGTKKCFRPSDQVFRLHGEALSSPCRSRRKERSVRQSI